MSNQPTHGAGTATVAVSADELTREVVDLMAGVVALFHREYEEAAAARSLTGAQAKVLALLRRGPMPMRHIAQTLSCEPSNITGIVDRLENRGFVTREADPHDRRVKLVAATEAGQAASEELRESSTSPASRWPRLPWTSAATCATCCAGCSAARSRSPCQGLGLRSHHLRPSQSRPP